jgi:hypothetical protein
MGKVHDVDVVKGLNAAAAKMRPAVAAFAAAVSGENINVTAEAKAEVAASEAVAAYEAAVAEATAAGGAMAAADKNLSGGILAHARAVSDEYAVDVIVQQRAKIKVSARKRHVASRPAVERALTSPRARREDIFKHEQDPRSPFAKAPRDGAIPAAGRHVKPDPPRMGVCQFVALVAAVTLVAFVACLAFTGGEQSAQLLRAFAGRLRGRPAGASSKGEGLPLEAGSENAGGVATEDVAAGAGAGNEPAGMPRGKVDRVETAGKVGKVAGHEDL